MYDINKKTRAEIKQRCNPYKQNLGYRFTIQVYDINKKGRAEINKMPILKTTENDKCSSIKTKLMKF